MLIEKGFSSCFYGSFDAVLFQIFSHYQNWKGNEISTMLDISAVAKKG